MRILNPGPGELLDRETILSIKIQAGRTQDFPVGHFEREIDLIRQALAPYRRKGGKWDAWWRDLKAVNLAIWEAIDELRSTGEGDYEAAARAGLASLHGNDKRCALVRAINVELGYDDGAEKIPSAEKLP